MAGTSLMVQRPIEMVSNQDTLWAATICRPLSQQCYYRAQQKGGATRNRTQGLWLSHQYSAAELRCPLVTTPLVPILARLVDSLQLLACEMKVSDVLPTLTTGRILVLWGK